MRKTIIATAAAGAVAVGAAAAAAGSAAPPSRLDDGKALLPQARLSEQDAIAKARTAASGALDEVDLEHFDGRLVWNVDVGADDVKVDAATGEVVDVSRDD